MFSNSKPAASLSSGLLARKGQARPAMRPQGFVGLSAAPMEDLGWNDMGDGHHVAAPVETSAAPAPAPAVLRQRERLAEEIAPEARAAPPVPETVEVPAGTVARIRRETGARTGKAAFTLRLDSDRHLRLRLASAVCNRSAQQLVTEALDAFLQSVPEIEELACRLPGREDR